MNYAPLAALFLAPVLAPGVSSGAVWQAGSARPITEPAERMYETRSAGVATRVVRVNLADPRVHVSVQVARGAPHGAESFEAMIARSRPTVAVNGAYFSKGDLKPIGDIVADGRQICSGMMGTALAITSDNRAVIRRVRWGHAEDWRDYETVLACGPALVLGGKVDIQPRMEGFHDPHVMGSARRMGVGATADRHLLIVTTLSSATFEQFAAAMRELGCSDAMNLDAGASLAMYYHGHTLVRPGRALTNLLLVHVRRSATAGNSNAKNRPAACLPMATRKGSRSDMVRQSARTSPADGRARRLQSSRHGL